VIVRPARPEDEDAVVDLLYESATGMYDLYAGRVLVRDPERARRWIPEGVEAVKRDVTERIPPQLSPAVAKAVSPATEGIARVTRRPPLIPRGQLYFFMWNAAQDSSKAQRELGWEPTRLEDGVRATLETLDL
jgi:hypothetical protein